MKHADIIIFLEQSMLNFTVKKDEK